MRDRELWAVGYGSDDSPTYCKAAASRVMRQENGLVSLLPPPIMTCPKGTGPGQAVIRQVFFGAAPSHLHSANSELAVLGIWSLKGLVGLTVMLFQSHFN